MKILITTDDGYNGFGFRTLIKLLEKDNDLTLIATQNQQSGVGGKITLKYPIKWEEKITEGHKVFVIDGTPADCMEFASGMFDLPFDYCVSGINIGENVGGAVYTSGTVMGATHSLYINVAKQALTISYTSNGIGNTDEHDPDKDISTYLEHPGKDVMIALNYVLNHNELKSARIVNINIPFSKSKGIKHTVLDRNMNKYWNYPDIIDIKNKTFSFPSNLYNPRFEPDIRLDTGAIKSGYTSITSLNF